MAYFDRFPLMAYDVAGNGNYKLLPNILRRVKLRAGIRSGSFLFDNYDVTDRYYQWPLTTPQFEEHLKDKYGAGNEDAVHHYEKTQDSGKTSSSGPNDFSHKVECNSDDGDPDIITNRIYEQRKQDEYRSIRLLDPRYLDAFIEEFDSLIRG